MTQLITAHKRLTIQFIGQSLQYIISLTKGKLYGNISTDMVFQNALYKTSSKIECYDTFT